MDQITGILSAEVVGKGTKSEGPKYFLQPLDDYATKWSKILVRKQAHLWENDRVLHHYVGKKVVILGKITETKSTITVDYEFVEEVD
ncbi:MAG: hypothetical protein EAX91_01935 [Candidatus Lokiarchaeota archaeon]|nr:hypothetical protein [Candidatus Lokiarchaeota archaeon]